MSRVAGKAGSVVLVVLLGLPAIADGPTPGLPTWMHGTVSDEARDAQETESHPQRILVRFEASTSRASQSAVHQHVGANSVLRTYRAVHDLCLVEVQAEDLEKVLQAYRAEPGVRYAQRDHVIRAAVAPNDPLFQQQWGLRNTGQTIEADDPDPGTAGADSRAHEAWEITTGSASFRVAVLDSGIDYTHPDLATNTWTNPGEIDGNGVDDDGNGWIDDVHGYDFVNEDGSPFDDNFHGTHVSGILGAVGDNGIGVAGVNWHVQIVALKILDATGTGFESDAIEAIDYLIANDIRLSNNSWGFPGESSLALSDAIAALETAGHLLVVASGNFFGRNIDEFPVYPASLAFPHMIVVAAVNNDDVLSPFSDIGPNSVDLGAPGENILSTLPGGTYGFLTGSSMATAHVTGTAALLWSRRPDLTWVEVRDWILRATRPVPSLEGRTVTGGVIDAATAVGDCNRNGIPDEVDIGSLSSADCNGNGLPDECEPDCNGNGVADACDISADTSTDCNGNTVPDECEIESGSQLDCNGNGRPDDCDLADGTSGDVNGTDVPDECESCNSVIVCDDGDPCTDESCQNGLCQWVDNTNPCDDGNACTVNDQCAAGICEGMPQDLSVCRPVLFLAATAVNGVPIPGGAVASVTATQGDRLTVDILTRNWSPQRVQAFNVAVDPFGFTSGATGSILPVNTPTPDQGAFVTEERSDFIFSGRPTFTIVDNFDPAHLLFGSATLFQEDCADDQGQSAYLATLVLDVSETASGAFQICLDDDTATSSFLVDCTSSQHLDPLRFECVTVTVPLEDCTTGVDCNGNGLWDICDITVGGSDDCNGNEAPDECDIASGASLDCNTNDVPDECDISSGTSADCDGNGVPDECEIQDDCNFNGIQDICDIAAGTSQDCNDNRLADECEIFFVDAQAVGNNDGTSWADAFTELQDGLLEASLTCGFGPQVWVAAGTYYPGDPGSDREATFQLAPDVRVLGGFAGGEESADLRDPRLNPTILSGDLNRNDDSIQIGIDDNSYHVVTGSDTNSNTLLDGFIITAGRANGPGVHAYGGGMIVDVGEPTVSNCLFISNEAERDGGGLYLGAASALFVTCGFSGNEAMGLGGAVRHAGGISGMTNCTLTANIAHGGGGGIFSGGLGNSAVGSLLVPSFIVVRNTILWGNTDGEGTVDEAAQYVAALPNIRNSCIQGLSGFLSGNGNIGEDPLFEDVDGPDDIPGTVDDNLHLAQGSACIDRGDNLAPNVPQADWDGDPRILNCRIDMGVDESLFSADCNENGLADTCEIVDEIAADCNDNLVPDECEADCNGNAQPDDCDLANGSSTDCFGNGVPDECEPDCNGNAVPDNCDIADGTSVDCNGNAIPDTCDLASGTSQDCNNDAEPDECLVTTSVLEGSPELSPIGAGVPHRFVWDGLPRAAGVVRITFFATADLLRRSQVLTVFINDGFVGSVFAVFGRQCAPNLETDDLFVPQRTFNALVPDGTAVIDVVASDDVNPDACVAGSKAFVFIRYSGANDRDCDVNGIPDECEPDTDGDGVIDNCDECPLDPNEVVEGACGCGEPVFDSDGDTVPDCHDVCPLVDDTIDENGDGIPDCTNLIPTMSQWGLVVLGLLLLVVAKLHFGRRTRCPDNV